MLIWGKSRRMTINRIATFLVALVTFAALSLNVSAQDLSSEGLQQRQPTALPTECPLQPSSG
jgi:hypothetical protein